MREIIPRHAVSLSGFRWAWLVTLVDIVFTAVAILSAHIPLPGSEQFWFNVHRAWYFAHLPAADLAMGLLPNFIASEMSELPVGLNLDLDYVAVCVAQTTVIGFVFGILIGLTQNKQRK